MYPSPARLQFGDKLFEIFIQMIDRLPFGFGSQLACALPVLVSGLAPVPGDFIIAQRRADDFAVPQITGHNPRLFEKLRGKRHRH